MRGHIRWAGFGALVTICRLCVAKIVTNPKDLFQASSNTALDQDLALWVNFEVTPRLAERHAMLSNCMDKWLYEQNRTGEAVVPYGVMERCHQTSVQQVKYMPFEEWRKDLAKRVEEARKEELKNN